MSDDHNQSRQSQPGNESSWDSEQPPIEDEGLEKDGSAPPDMRKSHQNADALNKEIDTGSLLRRITGSLYHVTGS